LASGDQSAWLSATVVSLETSKTPAPAGVIVYTCATSAVR
jgi:hypothetical protein